MAKIWFTSDNHFGHRNIMKFCPETRPQVEVEEMDRLMVNRWQELVAPEDTVYTLGDVFFSQHDRAMRIMDQLTGTIHLIWGNHDKVINKNSTLKSRFASVQHYLELNLNGIPVILFHFPIYEWNKMHYGSYHLYGHVHGSVKIEGRALDVGIDGALSTGDLSLYSWEQIDAYLSKMPVRLHHNKGLE